ncbi:MAG: TolC family protein, partial [Fibrella sp.]|nr:TolC family protein [Armatimonadota bacterium]
MKSLRHKNNSLYRYLAYAVTALASVVTTASDEVWGQDDAGTVQNAAPAAAAPPAVLTLADVLAQAEVNHPKLRGSDAERRAATAKRVSKQGAFDPVPFAGSDYLRYNSTSTRGKPLDTTMSDVGVELPFRNGIKVVAGTRLNLGSPKSPESSTGNTGEWNVSIKAPLRRGLGIN